MKTRKELEKRIRKLKQRLAKGTKKLAKLQAKLKAAPAESEGSAKKVRLATPDNDRTPPKPKRKLNISPERRAHLAAVMNARWAAKRAAAAEAAQQNPPAQPETSTTAGPSQIITG
jgi:cell division septum initiation protein DivIVA